uniref:LRR-RLK n=1 Tax=Rhizophora mucronata TaxID=61149 RepID=A0A2P2MSV5_RHIMU
MLTTWQDVSLGKEQLHLTAFSCPSTGFGLAHPNSPPQGSTLKSQFVLPSVLAISRKACSSLLASRG